MSTLIATRREESAHWYSPTGEPCHEVRKKDGGLRPTTLADARKNGWLPSVTTILKVIEKPALNAWKTEQALLAALTTPRIDGENDDAFVHRVLHIERQQDQESQIARDRGTEIHAAMESLFRGEPIAPELEPYCRKPYEAMVGYGDVWATEKVLVGDGYAGTADLIQKSETAWRIWDYKTCRSLPSNGKPWDDHVLQLSAYAAALTQIIPTNEWPIVIVVGNVYISTSNPGEFAIIEHAGDWLTTYFNGFHHARQLWQWVNKYEP